MSPGQQDPTVVLVFGVALYTDEARQRILAKMALRVGTALRTRREAFRLTREALASLAGVSVSLLSEIEAERYAPTALELTQLARALATDPAAIWRGDSDDNPARGTARFLAGQTLGGLSSDDLRLLALAAEVGRVGHFLWQLLGNEPSILLEGCKVTPCKPSAVPWWKQGYDLGRLDRHAIAPTPAPLPSVQACLEQQGVHVAFVDFDADDVIAASLAEPDALPVILLNRWHERVQLAPARRSVLAHELCHVMHDATPQHVVNVVSRRALEDLPIEQRANGYAPSFLAPQDWVCTKSGSAVERVEELSTAWLLSWEGACWHAKNLHLIEPADADRLIREAPRASWVAPDATSEERDLLPTIPVPACHVDPSDLVRGLVSRLVIDALVKGEVSRNRAAEIFQLR